MQKHEHKHSAHQRITFSWTTIVQKKEIKNNLLSIGYFDSIIFCNIKNYLHSQDKSI